MTLDEKIPVANWPRKSGYPKVVQIDLDGKPYLRFQEKYWEDHAAILKNLLDLLDIKYEEIKLKYVIVPALKGERYKVAGMGYSHVKLEKREASFYGESTGYEVLINQKHLDSVRPLLEDWELKYVPPLKSN